MGGVTGISPSWGCWGCWGCWGYAKTHGFTWKFHGGTFRWLPFKFMDNLSHELHCHIGSHLLVRSSPVCRHYMCRVLFVAITMLVAWVIQLFTDCWFITLDYEVLIFALWCTTFSVKPSSLVMVLSAVLLIILPPFPWPHFPSLISRISPKSVWESGKWLRTSW